MNALVKKYKEKSKIFVKEKFTDDGAGWLFLQQIIIAPMSIITTFFLTRILTIENYGYYKYILSIYGIVSIFSFSGIYSIAVLNIQRGQENFFNLAFKYKKILRWIPSVISLFIALYYFYHQNSFLSIFFLLNIFSYLIVDTYDFYLVALQGIGNYKKNMIFAIMYYFISYFPPIITAYFSGNLYLIFITMYICQGIYRFFIFKYVKNKMLFKNKTENLNSIGVKDIKKFKKESLSLSLNTATSVASVNASGVIVFNRLGAESNAIYSIALTFADFVGGIISTPLAKTQLLLSRITREKGYSKESDIEKKNYISSLFKKYFWLSLLGVVSCAMALPFVYKFLFPKYFFSYHYAVVYCISILAVSLAPAYQYLYEKRKFKIINIIQVVILCVNLVSLFFASMYFGVWGAIIVAIVIRFITNLTYTSAMYSDKDK